MDLNITCNNVHASLLLLLPLLGYPPFHKNLLYTGHISDQMFLFLYHLHNQILHWSHSFVHNQLQQICLQFLSLMNIQVDKKLQNHLLNRFVFFFIVAYIKPLSINKPWHIQLGMTEWSRNLWSNALIAVSSALPFQSIISKPVHDTNNVFQRV